MVEQVGIYCENKSDVPELTALLEANGFGDSAPTGTRHMGGLTPDLVVTGANVLIALANVVFSFLTARQGRQVKVKGRDGWEVTIPADAPQEQVEKYIRMASSKTPVTIVVRGHHDNA